MYSNNHLFKDNAMKKQTSIFVLILAGFMSCSLPAQVHYLEDFSHLTLNAGYSTIPANMIGINVDGHTPVTYNSTAPFNAAPYTNLAFAVDGFGTDTFATCTSYFTPAGTATVG